ncbi:outer membrane beta-barrel protein [Telluribacter humicola]|uniref:outer membrane beta-barrel protein n=1 Tax=Telluribacter humicola TaxID=1720261 RepID=UPI001A958AA0|nr:outer membrane beta-barrel protein [Telluribacter humicola]
MTKTLHTLLLGLLVVLASQLPAHAQLSIDATAGYGLPTESGSKGIWGGGIGVKHYFSSKLSVGGRIRAYSETIRQTAALGSSTLTAATIPIMASVQYYPTEWDLHPYIGMEVGIIRTVVNARIDYNDRRIFNDTMGDSSFGFAPKVGIGYDITENFALTGEFLYNIGFPKNLAGSTQFDLENSARFPTVHVGVSYTFGNRFLK